MVRHRCEYIESAEIVPNEEARAHICAALLQSELVRILKNQVSDDHRFKGAGYVAPVDNGRPLTVDHLDSNGKQTRQELGIRWNLLRTERELGTCVKASRLACRLTFVLVLTLRETSIS